MILSYLIERKIGKENVKYIPGWKQMTVGFIDAMTVFGPMMLILWWLR